MSSFTFFTSRANLFSGIFCASSAFVFYFALGGTWWLAGGLALALFPAPRILQIFALVWMIPCAAIQFVTEGGFLPIMGSSSEICLLAVCGAAMVHVLQKGGFSGRTSIDDVTAWTPPLRNLVITVACCFATMTLFRLFSLRSHAALAVLLLIGALGLRMPARSVRSASRQRIVSAVLALGSAAMVLVLVETGIRMIRYPNGIGTYMYLPDPDMLFTLRPGITAKQPFQATENEIRSVRVEFSEAGLRNEAVHKKGPDEFRIILLGDSFTFGFPVEAENTIGAQLEKMLTTEFGIRSVSVVNLGISGTAPWQQYHRLVKDGLLLEPDLVLQQVFLGNDPCETLRETQEHCATYDREFEENLLQLHFYHYMRFRMEFRLRSYSAIYVAIRQAVGAHAVHKFLNDGLRFLPVLDTPIVPVPEPGNQLVELDKNAWYPELETAWTRMMDDVQAVRDLCEEHGIRYAVYEIPHVGEYVPKLWREMTNASAADYTYGKGRALFREATRERDIPEILMFEELQSAGDPNSLYFVYDGHLTPSGNEVVAGKLARFVLRTEPSKTTNDSP